MVQATSEKFRLHVKDETQSFQASIEATEVAEGLERVRIVLEAQQPGQPPEVEIEWYHPIVDIFAFWHPALYRNKRFYVDWEKGFSSKSSSFAPVCSLFSRSGRNRLTFAFSDAMNTVELKAGVNEESASFICSVKLFSEPCSPINRYEGTLYIDMRDMPYYDSLNEVGQWWAELPDYTPAPVPDAARLPMYSTWYSFHQQLSPAEIEEQCRLSKPLGCDSVIVDDGWQTEDNARGYAYCGDWEVCVDKMGDMRAHVERVQQMGVKYMLWYSVPYVGIHSKAWSRFEHKLLKFLPQAGAGVLDPRYPEVRSYVIDTYMNAVRDWNLDGFKLDFIDRFQADEHTLHKDDPEMDYRSVPEAVDRLMSDVIQRLREVKPDIMIEFRQAYIGPLMRKYGNMFRAYDCPNDPLENRVRVVDIRLIAGDTAVHSDMIMWHTDESVESAAIHIINILFSVPQLSMRVERLPEAHREMVQYWLGFWREHRDVLLDGKLMPQSPESNYPIVTACNGSERIVCAYEDMVVNPGTELPPVVIIVNGTAKKRVVVEWQADWSEADIAIRNCQGKTVVLRSGVRLEQGLHRFDVPVSGTLEVVRR
ncbi:alpha-galactosidase [Paenibacillus sp. J5C_2022]|uniref:glycoside hydrolase family 36 protein n=1 Tax=Paenibacillus sp. J5C2022 TaxID=2977129 RepID=UPI0021D15001|nr:glycoside hydrolase family 36 protein [Paenibacillus sp. J5C2022]MCU6711223.1 alpha-galactosidase [Paenibacillus sp. J5C2022]